MEILAAVSALLGALAPYLLELRHRTDASEQVDAVAAALLELEERLASWAIQAAETNAAVREWADGLPKSAEENWLNKGFLFDSIDSQRAFMGEVDDALRSRAGLPPAPRFGRRKGARADLEGLLRVHLSGDPELRGVLEGREQLLGNVYLLPELYRDGGPEAVERYLQDLDSTLSDLRQARQRLADFIAERFPLGAPDPPSASPGHRS